MSAPEANPGVEVRRIEKPWGYELVWALTGRYCGKILVLRAGESMSLQYHREKEESWYVLEGRGRLEFGPDASALAESLVEPGLAFHIPVGSVHRLTAIDDLRILEVSTPELEDVVRLDDRYGRAGT